ncbi:MAG: NAD(P)/FAD-dependent oxidoreductase [archaeon]|nr:NAD(P)/FAD-dependent oxidoreductase [archaeon]
MDTVIVVGGGPAGLTVARECQKNGWKTTLIEEHKEIGVPINCTGIISADGVRDTGLKIDDIVVNRVRGARIFSPKNIELKVQRTETVAFVVERDKLDKKLAQEATEAGVELLLETSLLDVRNETVFVKSRGRGEIKKAKIVVGADGPYSKTRSLMGINLPKEKFAHAYQFRVKGNFEKDFVQVHLGSFARNYFAWVVPENEEMARIGLAVSDGSVRESFEEFEKKIGITGEKCDMCSALIPCAEPLRDVVRKNMMLVGDAALQAKATTGGGIIAAINAGKACAKAIDLHLKQNAPLSDYNKYLSGINRELLLHWKIRKYMNSLSDDKFDDLFAKMKKSGVEDFLNRHGHMEKPSLFVGKILKNPSMWRLFPDAINFFFS